MDERYEYLGSFPIVVTGFKTADRPWTTKSIDGSLWTLVSETRSKPVLLTFQRKTHKLAVLTTDDIFRR